MATATDFPVKVVIGVMVYWLGHFKPFIAAGAFIYLLGVLLLIAAQQTGHSVRLLIAAEALLAVSRSLFDGVKEVALLHSAHLEKIPILLAMLSVCDKVGGMIGATIADKVWATVLPNAPKKYLSGEAILSAERDHPFLKEHLSLAPGSPERLVIQKTYDDTQLHTLIAASVAMVIALAAALTMRNVSVFPPRVKPSLRVGNFWKKEWDRRDRHRPSLAVTTEPDMSPLFDCLDRMVAEQVARLETLWARVSEVVYSETKCPQHVADDLLRLFQNTGFSVWDLDRAVSTFKKDIETFWEPRQPTGNGPATTPTASASRPIRPTAQSLPSGGSSAECEICCLHDQLPAEGFIHLHLPIDSICVSASYGNIDMAFLNYAVRPSTAQHTFVTSGEPIYERWSHALSTGVRKAFEEVGVPPPPAFTDVWISQNHEQIEQSPDEQPMSHGWACKLCSIDVDLWVHVHLPAYGLCWTFNWEPGLPTVTLRVGAGTAGSRFGRDSAGLKLTPEQQKRLLTALERCISTELDKHYKNPTEGSRPSASRRPVAIWNGSCGDSSAGPQNTPTGSAVP